MATPLTKTYLGTCPNGSSEIIQTNLKSTIGVSAWIHMREAFENDFVIVFKAVDNTVLPKLSIKFYWVEPVSHETEQPDLLLEYYPTGTWLDAPYAHIKLTGEGVPTMRIPVTPGASVGFVRTDDLFHIIENGTQLIHSYADRYTGTVTAYINSSGGIIHDLRTKVLPRGRPYSELIANPTWILSVTNRDHWSAEAIYDCEYHPTPVQSNKCQPPLCGTYGTCLRYIRRPKYIALSALECSSPLDLCPYTLSHTRDMDNKHNTHLIFTDGLRGYLSGKVRNSVRSKIFSAYEKNCGLPFFEVSTELELKVLVEKQANTLPNTDFAVMATLSQTEVFLCIYLDTLGVPVLALRTPLTAPGMLSSDHMGTDCLTCGDLVGICGGVADKSECRVDLSGSYSAVRYSKELRGDFTVSFQIAIGYSIGFSPVGHDLNIGDTGLPWIDGGFRVTTSGVVYSDRMHLKLDNWTAEYSNGNFDDYMYGIERNSVVTMCRACDLFSIHINGKHLISLHVDRETWNLDAYLRDNADGHNLSPLNNVKVNDRAALGWENADNLIETTHDCGIVTTGTSKLKDHVLKAPKDSCLTGGIKYKHISSVIPLGTEIKVFTVAPRAIFGTFDMTLTNTGPTIANVSIYISKTRRPKQKDIITYNVPLDPGKSLVRSQFPMVANESVFISSTRGDVKATLSTMEEFGD